MNSMKNTFDRVTRHGGFLLLVALAASLAFAAESTPTISKAEAKQLIATANSPEDYQKLAGYFTQKAEMMDAEAAEHEELAKEYAKNPHSMKGPMGFKTSEHCKYFEQAARKAAAEDRALATSYESKAKTVQK
jgi:hypothetical protein